MKKLLLALALMMALPTVLAAAPQFDISLLSYTPVPAEPGQYVTLTFQVSNIGDANTKNAKIEFVDNYPFSLDNEATRIKDVRQLGSGEDFLAEYRIRIDSQALQGTNYLKVRYTPTGDNWFEKEIALTVSTASQKTISINEVTVIPEVISPAQQARVFLKVKNLGGSNLRDVAVQLNLAGALIGTNYVDLPFAPIGSSTEKRMSLLKSGQTADYEFELQSYPTAAAGIYKIPVTLSYTDENGVSYTRTDLISIVVNSQPDVMIEIDSSELKAGMEERVVISVTNRGYDEMKFVTLSIEESDSYHLNSPSNKVYLGNVDSDDYETAEFLLHVEAEVTELELPVTITYKDALNNEFTESTQLKVSLDMPKNGGSSSTAIIVVVAVIVIIIIFIVMRKRQKKNR